jgi:hypothetical protein
MAKSPTTTVLTHNHGAASVMARILSSENISVVVDRKARTASFDLRNRTLYLPEWESMTRSVYDMLIGHEISHALHTPCDGWRNSINKISGTTDTSSRAWQTASLYLNVVEDARIERLIKDKFPGFKRDFVNAYNELSAKNFFGVKNVDLNTLTLADRINLYYKLGTIGSVGIRFTAPEQDFITRIDACSSFEDAAQIAEDLFRFCAEKQDQSNPNEQGQGESSDTGKEGDGSDQQTPGEKNAPTMGSENDDKGGSSDQGQDQSDAEGSEQNSPTGSQDPQDQSDSDSKSGQPVSGQASTNVPTPITQENFNKNLERTVADNSNKYLPSDVSAPTRLVHPDISKVVVPFNEVLAQAKTDFPYIFTAPSVPADADFLDKIRKAHDEYERNSKRSVDLLLKQFELRKAAQISKRASIARTGILDMTRIPSYKFSEDLFRRNTRLPEGKNHGLVMFVDWSSSMMHTLLPVLEQCFVLVEFCRRAGIPFEVYAFSTYKFKEGETFDSAIAQPNETSVWNGEVNLSRYSNGKNDPNTGSVAPSVQSTFSLINLLSSNARKSDLKSMMQVCRAIASRYDYNGYGHTTKPRWDLGGTALDETIVAAMTIVPKFRDQNRLDIVHTVFLTDGDTSLPYTNNNSGTVTDPKTRAIYCFKGDEHSTHGKSTDTLLTAFRDITGSRAIGMFLTTRVSGNSNWFQSRFNKQLQLSEIITANQHKQSPYQQSKSLLDSRSRQHAAKELQAELMTQFKQENLLIADTGATGYDEFFIIRSDVRMDKDVSLDKISAGSTQNAIKKAFTKSFNNTNKSRVLVNRFIELIAR